MTARWQHRKVSSCTQSSQNTREKEREKSRLKKPRERDTISFHALQADEDHSTFSMGPIKADNNRNKDDRIFVLFLCTCLNIIFLGDALHLIIFIAYPRRPCLWADLIHLEGEHLFICLVLFLFLRTRRLTCTWWLTRRYNTRRANRPH